MGLGSWVRHHNTYAPLVEAPRSYPEFSCLLTDIITSLHALDGHSLKFPGVSLSLHCGSFPGNCALFLCVSSRVHSIVCLRRQQRKLLTLASCQASREITCGLPVIRPP